MSEFFRMSRTFEMLKISTIFYFLLLIISMNNLWEEKNLIEQKKSYENKTVEHAIDIISETKKDVMKNECENITVKKKCKICNNEKILVNFNKRSDCNTYSSYCKKCSNEYKKQYKKKNIQKIKAYNKKYCQDKKSQKNEYNRKYRTLGYVKQKIQIQQKIYRETNKLQLKLQKQNWYQKNKDRIREAKRNNKSQQREWQRIRMSTNITAKLSSILRGRLNKALNGNYKSGSAVSDLGCSISEFKSYLESKFQPGMTWDNYGLYGWHIDHIKPLANFDLTDRKQLLEACHYTNLQPLWAKDNLSKNKFVV